VSGGLFHVESGHCLVQTARVPVTTVASHGRFSVALNPGERFGIGA
jgi:hypothetical protein